MRILNLALPIGLALSSLCAPSAYAGAPDNNAATESVPRALPYEGHLAVDGVPLNGNVDVEFSLYGQSAPFDGEQTLFQETLPVQFVNGSFSVLLGALQVRMESAILDADDLYLGVSINRTTLSGRQRIVPVPRALWSARAANFEVKGDLTVAGLATVGALSLPTFQIPGGGGRTTLSYWSFRDFESGNAARVAMTPKAKSRCFLTGVIVLGFGGAGGCFITSDNTNWVLNNDDAIVCAATCLEYVAP